MVDRPPHEWIIESPKHLHIIFALRNKDAVQRTQMYTGNAVNKYTRRVSVSKWCSPYCINEREAGGSNNNFGKNGACILLRYPRELFEYLDAAEEIETLLFEVQEEGNDLCEALMQAGAWQADQPPMKIWINNWAGPLGTEFLGQALYKLRTNDGEGGQQVSRAVCSCWTVADSNKYVFMESRHRHNVIEDVQRRAL